MVGSIGAVSSGFQVQRPQGGAQSLTESQKSLISETLAKYDSETLTASDAKSITDTFKEAGIRPNQELAEVVSESGFDAREIGDLSGAGRPAGPPPPPPQESTSETDLISLLEEAFDEADIDENDQAAVLSFLEENGISKPGSLFDFSV